MKTNNKRDIFGSSVLQKIYTYGNVGEYFHINELIALSLYIE